LIILFPDYPGEKVIKYYSPIPGGRKFVRTGVTLAVTNTGRWMGTLMNGLVERGSEMFVKDAA